MRMLKAARLLGPALLAAACSSGDHAATAPDPDGAWMDGAVVLVASDAGSGRETVTLRDPGSGFEQVMDDEPLVAEVTEVDDPGALAMRAGGGRR